MMTAIDDPKQPLRYSLGCHCCSIMYVGLQYLRVTWVLRVEAYNTYVYTAVLRKVVRRNVHATIPKGNMGYDQYTVRKDWSCRTYFCCFNSFSTCKHNYVSGLPYHSFKFLWRTVPTKPPTIPFGIVACTFCDNVSRNSCIYIIIYICVSVINHLLIKNKMILF